jgi:2-iminobutanoate/2-iminopropanoate deaminase
MSEEIPHRPRLFSTILKDVRLGVIWWSLVATLEAHPFKGELVSTPYFTNPPGLAAPIGKYSHLVEVPLATRTVWVSGQVGQFPDGTLAGPDSYRQTLQVLENISMLLESLKASPRHIVKLLTFVSGKEHLPGFYQARDEVFAQWFPDAVYPGHSLAIVAALAGPDLTIEMEGVLAVPQSLERDPA